jgi:ornithine carbamoyltransferase
MFDGIEFRGKAQATVEELAAHSAVPVYNGLTDEWHPTQMLADFLTMTEHSGKRPHELAYCFMGDGRFNMGRSLLVTGAIMGADVRICAPEALWPDKDVQDLAKERAEESGGRITLTADPGEALPGADFVHTDVWVSMGEPDDVWKTRVDELLPFQVNTRAMERTGNPRARFMHCLPAFHDTATAVGRKVADLTGITDGLEVTDEVFRSPANIAFDQAENRLHTIKAVMVATIGD